MHAKFIEHLLRQSIFVGWLLIISTTAVMGATTVFAEDPNDEFSQDSSFDMGTINFFADIEPVENGSSVNNKQNFSEILQLIKLNQLVEARNKLSALAKQNTESAEFHNLTALLDTLENKPDSAEKHFIKALELDKENQRALAGMAVLELQSGHYDKAEVLADKLINFNDKNLTAYYLQAAIAEKQHKKAEIERILKAAYQKVRSIPESEIDVVVNLGNFYVSLRQPEKFLALAQELNNRYPKLSQTFLLLAQAQTINNQPSMAEQTLKKLIEIDKKNVNGRLQLATLWISRQDKATEIFQLMDEVSALAPKDPQMKLQQSALLIKLQRFGDALVLANDVDQALPQTGLGKILQGDIYLAQNRLSEALTAYQAAYQVNQNEKLSGLIADILNKQGNIPAAIDWLHDELKKNDRNLAAHLRLAAIYQQQNKLKDAENHYQAIMAVDSENIVVLNNLAWIYFRQNKPEALSLAEKAYRKMPDSAAIADTYGTILLKQGKQKQALDILEKTAEQAPDIHDISFHLAQAYVKSGHTDKALTILDKIVNSETNFDEKNAARDLLSQLRKN